MPTLQTLDCDVLVIGSGAAGLAAAVSAAHHGLRVVVAEKAAQLGGTSAWSGGWLWIPRNPLALAEGHIEPDDAPERYLKAQVHAKQLDERQAAFLRHGPEMVEFFQRHSAVQFFSGTHMPDMRDGEGSAAGGRSLCAQPYDGRELGPWLRRLREPLDIVSLAGMGIAGGADLANFLDATRSPKAALYALKRIARHWYGRLRYGCGTQLVNGNALVARLLRSALDLKVQLLTQTPIHELLREGGKVTGARSDTLEFRARRGVVLACGGFPHDRERIARLMPHAPDGWQHRSAAPPQNTGDGLRLGEAAGGSVETNLRSPVAWAPVSKVTHRDGSVGHFPHIIERGKPGIIGVLANGKRFVNEAHGYYDYVSAMLAALPEDQEPCSWLVCDQRFLRRYGLGYVRPAPLPIGAHLRSGYLKRGASIEQLAQLCGIDPQGLAQTVADFNRHARNGEDPAFGRGSTAFNRKQGDAANPGPNPCVAPIEHGPFYAVKVQPGCFGTFAGLKTDGQARVLGADGQPIPGLYAAGTDMASVFGGHYPSGGINLGPALTFGYVAGRHAAGAHDYEPQAGATPCKHASATATA